MAAGHSVGPARWQADFDVLMGRVAGRFARVEPRRRAAAFVMGLLARLPRTNCWTIAEYAGDWTPDGMQHLLGRAVWDAEAVREDVRGYLTEHLGDGDAGVGAVLVVDETGDLKKGTCTVGVQRQYTGTAGRIENAQVSVWLTIATGRGHGLIDRALYLPRCWAGDPARRAGAGVPAEIGFATKPQLARQMIARTLDAGVRASWVTGDEVYGADPGLRTECERRGIGYVLAVARAHRVDTSAGPLRADALSLRLPARAWQRRSAGPGAKGHRVYDWALIDINPGGHPSGQPSMLIRRHCRTGERAYYRCWTPTPVPLSTVVGVAGTRWAVEEDFQTGKGLTALDEHQVRTWTSWHCWTALVMLAHALLTATAATEPTAASHPAGQIPLTRNEISHLLAVLILTPTHTPPHRLHWSTWRRRHQHRARTSHYQRQATPQ